MADYDNTNRGTFSKNERKTTDAHPDIKGQVNVEGVEYWIDAWRKQRNSDGSIFYSLSVKRKDAQQAPAPTPAPAQKRTAAADLDDSTPFANPYRGGFLFVC